MGKLFGLIGYPLDHSWSKKFFEQKFKQNNLLDHRFKLFPIPLAKELIPLIKANSDLVGLNVTIPHKQTVLKYLNTVEATANEIGAVNCIRIVRSGGDITLMGYNTDVYGFEMAIKPFLKKNHTRALILGTGGSAGAVSRVLNKIGIEHLFVSRNPHDCKQVSYQFIDYANIRDYPLIINASPIGMFPQIHTFPDIPYEFLTPDHLLFDLVYNPELTKFLKIGKKYGAQISNGLKMLEFQADKSWEIWNA